MVAFTIKQVAYVQVLSTACHHTTTQRLDNSLCVHVLDVPHIHLHLHACLAPQVRVMALKDELLELEQEAVEVVSELCQVSTTGAGGGGAGGRSATAEEAM
jgi:hypothetical protein